jgi:hypothetical protein
MVCFMKHQSVSLATLSVKSAGVDNQPNIAMGA